MFKSHGNLMRRLGLSASLILAAILIISLTPSCEKENPAGLGNENPAARLVSHSDCKPTRNLQTSGAVVPIMDCVQYELQGNGTLLLKHVNAAFNCCPEDINAEITIKNDTITIAERESLLVPCPCLCLYDLNYSFENLEAGTYTFIFIEPYTSESDVPLKFTVDLISSPSDTICVERNHYPWDTGGGMTEPSGTLLSHTECKTGALPTASAVSLHQDCVEYRPIGYNTFSFKHVNAGFNCCPDELVADIIVRNDTITVIERELLTTPCHCLCLYDMEYRFEMEPGTYTFVFVEPYVNEGDAPLTFTVDLVSSPSGSYCVARDHYPWDSGGAPLPTGGLTSHSTCLTQTESPTLPQDTTFFQKECAIYGYRNYTLLVKHVHAVFNCCPDDITGEVVITGDIIRFIGHEILTNPCLCVCPYDLDYKIENLPPGTYTFIFGEPSQDDHNLRFTTNLVASPSDTFCVNRPDFPWNNTNGGLISHTQCKTGTSSLAAETVPGDMDCVEYQYAPGGTLALKHINAGFNCCPGDLTADITVANGVITIVEHEAQSMCDCSCLYDLNYEIRNLEPRQYTLKIVELYLSGNDAPLEFPIDLAATPACFVGRYRDHYPWTYQSTMPQDKAVLDRMRAEIINFIGTPSCSGDGDCRYIALGVKPCGGPWEYLIYSAATIDVPVLKFMVCRYNAFNDAFNRRYNLGSDCMFVLPPTVGCVGGVCTKLD